MLKQKTTLLHGRRMASLKSAALYLISTAAVFVGFSYACVPLYRIFCKKFAYGGTTQKADSKGPSKMVLGRDIHITFNADRPRSLPWTFVPLQEGIEVVPGERALAFYKATNHSDVPIIGIATYNVMPAKAGLYFNKIQCFCFDEQRIGPHQTVSLPVHFFLDPELCDDPNMDDVNNIVLSYTFFKATDQEFDLDTHNYNSTDKPVQVLANLSESNT